MACPWRRVGRAPQFYRDAEHQQQQGRIIIITQYIYQSPEMIAGRLLAPSAFTSRARPSRHHQPLSRNAAFAMRAIAGQPRYFTALGPATKSAPRDDGHFDAAPPLAKTEPP